MKITVYSKPGCVQCTATYRALDKKGLIYEVVDLVEHPEQVERLREQGHMQMPVVEASGDTWAGFRPDKIEALMA